MQLGHLQANVGLWGRGQPTPEPFWLKGGVDWER